MEAANYFDYLGDFLEQTVARGVMCAFNPTQSFNK